jgi:hypothetical protein
VSYIPDVCTTPMWIFMCKLSTETQPMFLQNKGWFSTDYMVLYLTRRNSSTIRSSRRILFHWIGLVSDYKKYILRFKTIKKAMMLCDEIQYIYKWTTENAFTSQLDCQHVAISMEISHMLNGFYVSMVSSHLLLLPLLCTSFACWVK